MTRLIFWLALILVAYVALRAVRNHSRASRSKGAPSSPVEKMVSCSTCGINLPQGEAISIGDSFYCSEDHERAHRE